jgi:transketolase
MIRYQPSTISLLRFELMNTNYVELANESKLDNRSRELRSLVLDSLEGGGRGHLASALSLIEIVRVLYDEILVHDPSNPFLPNRDRFILSKGHGCLGLFVVMADHGYFSKELLQTFCSFDSNLGGHPEKFTLPGIEFSTGSLGHGFSVGTGMAMAARLKNESWRTFILLGDGELNEGAVWEATMHAAQHKLGSLTIIIDYNQMQASGTSDLIVSLAPLHEKFKAFGFEVSEVNGHDVLALTSQLKKSTMNIGKPRVVIAHTIKGKGIFSSETSSTWHHKSKITKEEITILRRELQKQ